MLEIRKLDPGSPPSPDDQVLGEGCTDGAGTFTSSPGIALIRPLEEGDVIYAFDELHGISGPAVALFGAAPAPVLGDAAKLLAVLLLLGVAAVALRRSAHT